MAESRGGRPIAASSRPTGGDKAMMGNKRYFRRKKVCFLYTEKIDHIDYKDTELLKRFVTERGKIIPRRISGASAQDQRRLRTAIKRARNIAMLPFASKS
jgi:small subunit ribosomal protein S18